MDPRYSSSIPIELRYLSYWIAIVDREDLEPDLSRPSRYAHPLSEVSTCRSSDILDYEVGVEI